MVGIFHQAVKIRKDGAVSAVPSLGTAAGVRGPWRDKTVAAASHVAGTRAGQAGRGVGAQAYYPRSIKDRKTFLSGLGEK